MTHSGEKPHRCSECDFSSSTTSNLTIHTRSALTGKNHTSVANASKVLFLQVICTATQNPMLRRRLSFAMIAAKHLNMDGASLDMS